MHTRKASSPLAEQVGSGGSIAYLLQLFHLVIPLGRVVLVVLDGAQEEKYLSDDNLDQGAVPSGATGTRAGSSTQAASVGRMRRVTRAGLQGLC